MILSLREEFNTVGFFHKSSLFSCKINRKIKLRPVITASHLVYKYVRNSYSERLIQEIGVCVSKLVILQKLEGFQQIPA